MNKTTIKLLAIFMSIYFISKSQTNRTEPCISNEILKENILKNPSIIQEMEKLEAETQEFEFQQSLNPKAKAAVKIIPVVFHIIHQYGVENISRAQCLDQIRILNEDFRRLNADTNNTPIAFRPIAADCNIEFKIAQIDPNGNCTDGVNRIYSAMTNGARDNVKALISWPRSKYMNVWVVKNINSSSTTEGYVIGFAQFPGGAAATDGIVLRQEFVGNIGTGAGSRGRTATHEVGHWLNLRHIWGDDGSSCNGSDNVSDTPNQGAENFSTCPTFPSISCNNGPNGDLYSNYMDYTNAACQNVFTAGQSTRMNAALASSVSSRSTLWSAANLIATGVNNPPVLCSPVADFTPHTPTYICEGQTVTMNDKSYGGAAASRIWYFDGGTPSTSTSAFPTITYAIPGTYNVSLKVINTAGTDSITKAGVIIVMPNSAAYQTSFFEGFENSDIPNSDWTVANFEATSVAFQRTNTTSFTGNYSCMLNVNNNTLENDVDELISTSFNLTNYQSPKLTFRQAYAQTVDAGASDNRLIVQVSTNCGKNWNQLVSYAGTSLATAGTTNSNFVPSINEWIERTIVLNNFANNDNVRFKFKFTGAATGNNLYLDDINISALNTNIDDIISEHFSFKIFPNPSINNASIEVNSLESTNINIEVYDAIGKLVVRKNNVRLGVGKQNLNLFSVEDKLSAGVYSVKLNNDKINLTQKLLIKK